MTNPVLDVRQRVDADDRPLGRGCHLWCPGCDQLHGPVIANEDGTLPAGPTWSWNGDLEHPTFEPSLLVRGGPPDAPTVCHSFVRAGRWEFLSDSTHALAGQTVDLVPLPDWVVK